MKCGISEVRSALHDFRTGYTTSFFARLTVEKPKILVVKLKKTKLLTVTRKNRER